MVDIKYCIVKERVCVNKRATIERKCKRAWSDRQKSVSVVCQENSTKLEIGD